MAGRGHRPKTDEEVEAWVRSRFALPSLRQGQAGVIRHLLAGRRVLFVAPTGHGKSLCYQALAASAWSAGVVLVFQPLKALMQEQVARAEGMGLRAALVNSDLDAEHQRAVLKRATQGELDILFLAPERQGNAQWIEHVAKMEIKGVVIDEAHCISQWGHDFRPWYRRLVQTTLGLGLRTPVLAVTATAPSKVVDDVRQQIGPEDQPIEVVRLPSYRANLELRCSSVAGLTDRLAALLEIARARGGTPGIAYVLTVDEAEIAADLLKSKGIATAAYYGDLASDDRQAILAAWNARRIPVVCATSALGMGIDRADVRWIAHVGMPDSLLRYVQEIGRAGRDGKPAFVIGIHDSEAQPIYAYFVHASSPDPADYRAVADLLRAAPSKRTPIVERLDIPENTVQRILDDFVRDELCERDGTPFEYTWTGGKHTGVPEGIEESIATRRRFLEETKRYVDGPGCRAVELASAMGDEPLPQACRRCDRCRKIEPLDLDQARRDARDHLAGFGPPIRASKGHHEGGIALSRYGLGEIGEAVKSAKYGGGVLPATALDRAVNWARDLAKAKRGPPVEVVVSIPSTTSPIVADFAASFAKRLGVPWVEVVKTRDTRSQKSFRSKRRKQLNIQGAFALPAGAGPYAAALLVDDVLDSGESLKAAGRALRPAKVVPVVMARAKHQDDA